MPPKSAQRAPSAIRTASSTSAATVNGTHATSGSGESAKTTNQAAPIKAEPLPSSLPTTKPIPEITSASTFTPEKDRWDGKYEFGGPIGALGLIVFSHFLMYYFWACITQWKGQLAYPGHPVLGGEDFFTVFWGLICDEAAPTLPTMGIFTAYLLFEYLLAVVLPGPATFGLPLPSEGGARLSYKCNAIYAWYILLAALGALHYYDVFPLQSISDQFGRYMTAAVLWGDFASVALYIHGVVTKKAIRMSGNLIYDFFMGSSLNPRLPGGVDIKLFAELRNSWTLLFVLTLSSGVKMYVETGTLTNNMALLILAQWLYSNACQKGEECVVTTWDIFYEKFGWMLIFWNTAGVPFLYCFQSLFLLHIVPTLNYGPWHSGALLVFLLVVYWIWDTVNSQKNRFRMKRQGVPDSVIRRKTFPQLPWGYIENPRTIKSERGELFVDGWYRRARKFHYTADLCMSFFWGYCCGTSYFIPYFYFCFFLTHLVHRVMRDEERCAEKYGPLWKEYTTLVPYRFIPGLF